MYGNEQAQYTMNRAAYGGATASMITGANTIYGGAYSGINNMLSDIGSMVMPVGYTPPARVSVGFYGQNPQHMGFMSSTFGVLGLNRPGRSQMAADHLYNVGSDFGERVGGGAVGLGATVAGIGVGSVLGRLGGGLMGSLAGGLVGSLAAGAVTDAVGQRREINNFLEQSSFRYVGAGSDMSDPRRGGMGFEARRTATDMIRQMDVQDPFMSTEDLSMILQQGTQKGMFAGTQDMGDFKKKFKELTDTVKVVTRTLGQTLDEAMSTIKELKTIGVDPTQARGIVSSADALGRMAGRTGAEMLNLGLQGAELFRGTGVTMGIGAQATMMNLASVRAARDAGQLSSEAVAQAGGEEALSMRMNASGLAFAQSSLGRGFGGAFFNPAMGGGGFNSGAFMSQMMGGGMSLTGLATTAVGNLGSLPNLISYQANQEKFMSEAGKTFGGRGLQMMQTGVGMAQAQFLSSQTGANFEDSYRLSLKQMGLSQSEIETNIAEARGAERIFKAGNAAAQTTYERAMVEEGYRGNALVELGSKLRDFGKGVLDSVARPLDRVIDSAKESAVNFIEEQVYGVQRASTAGINLTRTIAGGMASTRGPVNLDEGGFMGGRTAGEAIARALTPEVAKALGVEVRTGTAGAGDAIIEKSLRGTSNDTVINIDQAVKAAEKYNFSAEEAKKAQESGALKEVKGGTLLDIIASGNVKTDMDSISRAAFGKEASKLSKEELMKLSLEIKGTVYEDEFKRNSEAARLVFGAKDASDAATLIKATKDYRESSEAIKSRVTSVVSGVGQEKITDDAVQLIADAANTVDPKAKEMKMAEAEKALLKSGIGASDAKKMLAEGITLTEDTKNLANAHESIKAAQLIRGSSALGRQLETGIRSNIVDKPEADRALGVATQLAAAKTPDELIAIADGNTGIIKKMGGAGVMVSKSTDILKKIGSKSMDSVAEIESAMKGAGLSIDDQMKAAIDKSDYSGLKTKVFEAIKSQQASTSAITAPGGVQSEGGMTAAQTLEQQVNINMQILQAMSALSQKLGVK